MKTEVSHFKDNIRSWYKNNARNFSWRKTNDPWKIYLIEILSQQTQLDRANKYYKNLYQNIQIQKKWHVASKKKILKLWSGLGYNNRAIRLHESAKY